MMKEIVDFNVYTIKNGKSVLKNININGNINIDTAQEQHQHQEIHDTWGGDIGMAALGGAMTGLAGGLGMGAGNFLGSGLIGVASSGAAAFGSSNVGAVISENLKGTTNGTYTTNQIGSDIVALNNINITTNNNLNIIGSDLTSLNNTTLTSNNGSVNILAAIETQTTEKSETKTNWGGIDFTHTNSSVGIDAKVDRKTTTTTTNIQTAKSSNIKSGKNLLVNSNKNINIASSNLVAENDINLKATNGELNILSMEQKIDSKTNITIDTIHAGINFGNSYLNAIDNLYNTVDTASRGNHDTKQGYTNASISALNSIVPTYNAIKTAENIKQMSDLLSFTNLGFTFGTDLYYTRTEAESNQTLANNKSSNIISNNGNIDLNADKDINIKGSNILATAELNNSSTTDKGNINIASNTGNITIESTQSRQTSNTEYTSWTAGTTVGYGEGENNKEKITNENNTNILGRNVSITLDKDNKLTLTQIDERDTKHFKVFDTDGNKFNESNIVRNTLQEKDTEDSKDWSISANLFTDKDKSFSQNLINGAVGTQFNYKDSDGYDFKLSANTILGAIALANTIKEYTGKGLSWLPGLGGSTYKAEGKTEDNQSSQYNSTFDSVNEERNNIGEANIADHNITREQFNDPDFKEKYENEYKKVNEQPNFKLTEDMHFVGDKVDFSLSLTKENGLTSNLANILPGMNAMSIMHDKWADGNVGLLNGKLSNAPYLQLSILPAIPVTYLGLIGETINIFNIKTNLDDLSNLYNPNDLKPDNNLDNINIDMNLNNKDNFGVQDLVNQLRSLNESK